MNRSASKFRRQVTCRSWIQTTFFHAAKLVVDFANSTVVGKISRHAISATCLFWLAPVAGLLLMVMAAYRWAMQRLIHYMHPDEDLQMADALPIRMAFDSSDKFQSIVTLMLILSGLPDIEEIRTKIDELLDPAGPLGCRAALFKSVLMTRLGIHCWKPSGKNFKVENHVLLHSGKWRGTAVSTRNLQAFTSELLSFKPLPDSSPPWQIVVVPVRQLDCRSVKYAMIFRVHHLLMNGMNVLRDILVNPKSCLDNLPSSLKVSDRLPNATNLERPFTFEKVLHNYLLLVWSTLGLLYELVSLAVILPPLIWNHILGLPACRNHPPIDEVNQKVKMANISWSEDISVSLLERMEEKTGSSKQELLLACLTGAVRHYFQRMSGEVPKSVFCALPESELGESLCTYQERPSKVYTLALPISKVDPLSRLSAVNFRTFNIKKQFSNVALVTGTLLSNMQRFIPYWMTRLMLRTVTRNYTFLVNGISIPSNCVTSWGGLVENINYWRPPLSNIGVSLSLVTYGDKVSLGILACPRTLHRPDELSLCFVKELHDLALSLGVKMERKVTPPPSPCSRDVL